MTNTTVNSLLQSLCDNEPWSYAVFWKVQHENNMILTWEEGCFYDVQASIKVEDKQYGESANESVIIPIYCFHDGQHGTSANLPIKVALECMSNHVYLMGDGIVGRAALEKRPYWIFCGEANREFLFEHSEDWQLQLEAGIKTVLLIPVGNYGVVQLGSVNTVVEDFNMVAHIRGLFSNLSGHSQTFSSLNSSADCSSTSPLYLSSTKRSMLTAGLFVPHNSKHFSSLESDLFPVMDGLLSSQNFANYQALGFDTSRYGDETDFGVLYNNQLSGPNEGILLSNSFNFFGGDMSNLVITENEMTQPIINCISDAKQFDSFIENQDGWFSLSDAEATLFQEVERDYNCRKNYDGLFLQEDNELPNLPIDLELLNASGSTKMGEPDGCFFNMTMSKANMVGSSIPSHPTKGSENSGFPFDENHSGYLKDGGDDLLEAVLSSFHCQSYNISEGVSSHSSEKLMESCLTQSTNEFSISELGNSLSTSKKRSVSDAEGNTGSLATSLRSINRMTNENENCETNVRGYRKQDNKVKLVKGDKHKPRPRDRQLIQDRIKELRGLIPNGSNCSIDALLDNTVRHMLFLRGISSRADKLRQSEDKKVKEEVCDSVKPGNCPNGASWAYEVGSKPAKFPLIIENLDQPGQILVEMLCKDYGLFLEIVHVIRHLDLMILKGVLESRSDKLWAHFVLEVSKDFQRTQILWPLMQLVQQNYK